MIDTILDLIASAIKFVVDFIIDIIDGVISFWNDLVDYFKKLTLVKGRDLPFVVDAKKIRGMLDNAPTMEIPGLFEGVYNEETDKIEHGRFVYGNDLDEKTKDVIKDQGIVILT